MKNIVFVLLSLTFALSSNSAFAALTQTEVSQLYIGVFGRASEGSGNLYWQTDPQSTSMTATANSMLNTDPAIAYFGSTLSNNQAFIEHIYLNTLGKTYEDDPNGIFYWVSELETGKTKDEVIAALIIAAQHSANAGAAQDRFNNKTEVSNYCADKIFKYTDLETFTGFISSVTDDVTIVTSAKGLVDVKVPSSSCDSNNLNLCATSSECSWASGNWGSDNTCDTGQETTSNCNTGSDYYDTTTEVVTVISSTGQVWMDRNLGASCVATSYNDPEAYGDLYQWGRGKDGHEKRTSDFSSVTSDNDDPDLDSSPDNDGKFITTLSDSGDWRSSQNDNLWQGVSGTNNP